MLVFLLLVRKFPLIHTYLNSSTGCNTGWVRRVRASSWHLVAQKGFAVYSLLQTCAPSPLICASWACSSRAMKLDLQRSKLPTRRVTEGLVSVSLAVLLAGGPTPAALASTPSTLLAGGGRFLDGEAGLLWDEATKTRMMEKANAAKEKVAHAHRRNTLNTRAHVSQNILDRLPSERPRTRRRGLRRRRARRRL